jgi:hypothetical protein
MSSFQFGGSMIGSRSFATSNALFAGRSITNGRATLGATAFGGFGRFGSPGLFRPNRPRFGFGFRRFPLFRPFFGFGFGLGFGWGSCWDAAWAWDDPFCFNPYSYHGYPPYDPYGYAPSVGYDPTYDPNYLYDNPPPESSLSVPPGPSDPNGDASANAPGTGNPAARPAIIYMKDGTSFAPSDYWISEDQLYYAVGGRENAVDIDRVDLLRSNDENYKNGVKFWLRSAPNASPASSGTTPGSGSR